MLQICFPNMFTCHCQETVPFGPIELCSESLQHASCSAFFNVTLYSVHFYGKGILCYRGLIPVPIFFTWVGRIRDLTQRAGIRVRTHDLVGQLRP